MEQLRGRRASVRGMKLAGLSTAALMASGFGQNVSAQVVDPLSNVSRPAQSPGADSGQRAPAGGAGGPDDIIVTGTRDRGVTARASATPIEVVSNATLAATGATNAFDALRITVPSFSNSADNGSTAELTGAPRLRGLNGGETLILINGKRRHPSANVHAAEDMNTTSNPADLNLIPISLIDHVEVLLDGAAAQYGSDAVAGVINIILKTNRTGGMASILGGITSRGDGAQAQFTAEQGFSLGSDGFLDVSVEYRHHAYEVRGGYDVNSLNLSYGPVRNKVFGSPLLNQVTFGYNMEKPLSPDVKVYSFGTVGYKAANINENDRLGTVAPTYYPTGFTPQETLRELDGAVTAGIKGGDLFGGFDWDLGATYGHDSEDIGVANTVNTGLVKAGETSPRRVFAGNESTGQATVNLDIRRPIANSLFAAPINVAFGAEVRRETYSVKAGDLASYTLGGTQAFSGFTPSTASNSHRYVYAGYADLSTKPLRGWTVDGAVRYESFTGNGTGDNVSEKFTTRYDIIPQLALRGGYSTGFHAPSLGQINFATTSILPLANGGQSYTIQLPLNSPGAALLGAPPLKPERSRDLNFGVVLTPFPKLHLNVDYYKLVLKDRIINTGSITGALALAAAAANGNTTPVGSTSAVKFFTNGVDTTTRGVDFSADYTFGLNRYGSLKLSVLGNYNKTHIDRLSTNPALAKAFQPDVLDDLTVAAPKTKVTGIASWIVGRFDMTLRETRYGKTIQNVGPSAVVPYSEINIKPAFITDLDIVYHLSKSISAEVGANNLFNKLPNHLILAQQNAARQSGIYPTYTQWGTDGAYYYVRLGINF